MKNESMRPLGAVVKPFLGRFRFMDRWLGFFSRGKDWADRKLGVFSRLVQFCIVGGSGMVFDLGIYKILLVSAFAVPLARGLAIWIAMTWNYTLNRRLTFHDAHKESIPLQYMKFAAGCGLGALVSWSIAVGLDAYSEFFNHHKLYAAFLGIVAGTLFNFLISWLWVFHRHEGQASMPKIQDLRPKTQDLKSKT